MDADFGLPRSTSSYSPRVVPIGAVNASVYKPQRSNSILFTSFFVDFILFIDFILYFLNSNFEQQRHALVPSLREYHQSCPAMPMARYIYNVRTCIPGPVQYRTTLSRTTSCASLSLPGMYPQSLVPVQCTVHETSNCQFFGRSVCGRARAIHIPQQPPHHRYPLGDQHGHSHRIAILTRYMTLCRCYLRIPKHPHKSPRHINHNCLAPGA